MIHEDFYKLYKEIRRKEVAALKSALQKFPQHQYEWADDSQKPVVVAIPKHYSFSKDYDICKVTENVDSENGIFIKDTDTNAILQVGFVALPFGSIDYILDCLPEVY